MNSNRFRTLAIKEFRSFINAPLAYLIIVPFLLIISFLFLRTALMLGDANLRPFVELLPWFLVVIGPALAMKSFAEEQKRQTVELLFAHPVSEWLIATAKFTGLCLFYLLMLGATIGLPLVLIGFSKPDIGLMLSQYLGAFLIGATFLAIGMAASAYVGNAVGSFLLGAAVNLLLMFLSISFVTMMFPGFVGRIVAEIGIQGHIANFSRGVIDFRDLLYFATVIGVALTATVLKLSERKVVESKTEKSKLVIVMFLVVGIGLVGNFLMYEYPLQLDLTANHRYSLSSGTKKLLKELPDRVGINLYTSANLPAAMQLTLRDTSDMLKDFRRYGNKVQVASVVVGDDPVKQQEAQTKGIRQVQFNQIGSSSFQVQTGFLGLEIRYGDKTEVIDFIEDANNLEYELARRVLKLTRKTQPKIGLVQTPTEGSFNSLSQMLSDQYQVVMLSENPTVANWQDLSGVVVIDDGSDEEKATVAGELKNYLTNQGSAIFFMDGVAVDTQALSGRKNTSDLTTVLNDFGITLKPQLVYDLQRNEAITLGSGNNRYIMSYPFWIRPGINDKDLPFAPMVSSISMGWASPLTLNEINGWKPVALFTTSKMAGIQEENFTVAPDQVRNLTVNTGTSYVTAAVAQKEKQRLALIADTQMIGDDFLTNSQENRSLAVNIVDWAAADPTLSLIPQRTGGRSVFTFSDASQAQTVQWVAMLLPPAIVVGLGGWWLNRRKKLTYRVYEGGL